MASDDRWTLSVGELGTREQAIVAARTPTGEAQRIWRVSRDLEAEAEASPLGARALAAERASDALRDRMITAAIALDMGLPAAVTQALRGSVEVAKSLIEAARSKAQDATIPRPQREAP